MKGGVTKQEPLHQDDADYESPPPFSSQDLDQVHEEQANSSQLRASLQKLSHEQLVDRLVDSEHRLDMWQNAASNIVSTLTLSPDMTEGFYARYLRDMLSSALLTLDSVDDLRHVECSMPCVKAEFPSIQLLQWTGLTYSEWHVEWSPHSWWVSVSADGSRWGLGFNVLTRVSDIHLDGVLRCAFSKDLTSLRFSFADKPLLEMTIESSVGWGVVPIPVREQIESMVRAEIERFVESRLTGDESMTVFLRRKAREQVSESDILEATEQAKRASNVNLRSALLL